MIETVAVFAASLCLGLIAMALALWLFSGHAAAGPVERSNHVGQTPQIGGLALVPLFVLAMVVAPALTPATVFSDPALLAAVLILFVTGLVDDRTPLGALPKLAAQLVACAIAVYALRGILGASALPIVAAATVAFVTLVVLINLANFMDGLDLMAVSTVGIPALVFALLASVGMVSAAYAPPAIVLVGLLVAFAVFNRPPARAFLGDAGSLPLGLLVGVMTVVVASAIGLVPALLVPAYLLCDGLVTLARRMFRGENILHAHSSHVYQRAYRAGRGVYTVVLAATATGACAMIAVLLSARAAIGWQIVAALAVFALWWLASLRLLRNWRA